jgi:hypothetical protein
MSVIGQCFSKYNSFQAGQPDWHLPRGLPKSQQQGAAQRSDGGAVHDPFLARLGNNRHDLFRVSRNPNSVVENATVT